MRAFLDSSSFAKRFVDEKGSDAVDRVLSYTNTLGLSVICIPEIISALNRNLREKNISKYEYSLAKDSLLDDVRDAEVIQLTPMVIARTISLLETNNLRTMDALHIACALEWRAQLFVSSDEAQIKAARKAKLKCKYI